MTNTSGALSRIAGAPFSARCPGTLSAPTSGCSDQRGRAHSDHGVNIQYLARLRILANDCSWRVSHLAPRPREGPFLNRKQAFSLTQLPQFRVARAGKPQKCWISQQHFEFVVLNFWDFSCEIRRFFLNTDGHPWCCAGSSMPRHVCPRKSELMSTSPSLRTCARTAAVSSVSSTPWADAMELKLAARLMG